MHGLVNRSIQCFLRDTYGESLWLEIASRIGISENGFESMLIYDDSLTMELLDASTRRLDKPVDMLLEDVGTYLVSHPNTESIRRLLRFGGETFFEFLHSLDDLPDRARLAMPDLSLPNLELIDIGEGQYELQVSGAQAEYAFVLVGILRAMADDFGALVFLDQALSDFGHMSIRISLLDSAFSEGRSFSLARPDASGPEALE
ncbi:heme NO-binding domain-containing protein [Tropicimonas sp. TH_r6]|uniref:heme NO-binding domain-containing protein n=1 Tax=Tropicimonas sp. TH_r6 TaxID=3082085 RepID=UPI00295551C8|nr:heme NO-binding domain-containing protein [Tropicimonas sp. TH_r6]MDV7144237.1 heme NO-binding domain-containing protein [Tropicimonas sp. TH_r6]